MATAGKGIARFPALDGFRALAMLSVFFFHAWLPVTQLIFDTFHIAPDVVWRADSVVPNLNIGVAMFFVLSGFLIYRPFAVAHLDTRPRPNLANYARRRGLRIYPAYWLVFFVLLASGAFVRITGAQIIVNLALIQSWFTFSANSGLGQAWTLVVEVAFYAFVPLWSTLVRRWARDSDPVRGELVGAGLLTLVGVAASCVQIRYSPPAWFTAFLPHLAALAPGMVLAILSVQAVRDPRWCRQLSRLSRYAALWWLAAGGLFWLLCTRAVANPFFPLDFHGMGWQIMLQPIIAILMMAPLVMAPHRITGLSAVLSWRPIAWIGTVSYGAYLWHGRILELGIVQHLMHHAGAGRGYPAIAAGTLLALALTLLAGATSWYALERPLQRLGQRSATQSVRL